MAAISAFKSSVQCEEGVLGLLEEKTPSVGAFAWIIIIFETLERDDITGSLD